ncbi:MAG: diacylglycerol kinase [Pyramidobacter sp.]|jgi:diacylglycerol kinase (ATP)
MEHFLKACRNSRDGFRALLGERAFRQELMLLTLCLTAAALRGGWRALAKLLPWGGLVLIAEALNTAVEKTVDLVTDQWHPLAKIAKDAGSFACGTAVFVFLVVCLGTLL